jgi:predicted GNAT family N-acyltransferase
LEIISVITEEQLGQALNIRKEVFVREQQVPADLEIDEYDTTPQACHHMLALDGGDPIATGRWRFYEEDTAKLQRVAVRKDYRGTGAGKAIILALEAQAKAEGALYTILDGQCQAEGFYRKLGYETISTEPFYDAGILHVRMRKRL